MRKNGTRFKLPNKADTRKGKFKNTLVTAVKTEEAEKKEQKRLHEKHHVEDQAVKIVEKDNFVKFTVRTLAGIFRYIATIVLFILATIGVVALLYPNVRTELFVVVGQLWMELQGML